MPGKTIMMASTALALCVMPTAHAQDAVSIHGILPQGVWVRNLERSRPLNPSRQTLWVIKDDGKHQVWASAFIDDQHRALVVSYDGAYGGPASPVIGTPMTTQIVATGPHSLHNFGKIAGVGDYTEDCVVSPDNRRFRCEGQINDSKGVKTYADDFDWYGENPPAARP